MRYVSLLALAVALVGCDAAGPDVGADAGALADAREKVPVCHYDATAGTYELLSVAAPALGAHRAHGDAQPGEAVPTQAGAVFDEACQPTVPPVPPLPTCFADLINGWNSAGSTPAIPADPSTVSPWVPGPAFLGVAVGHTNEAGETYYLEYGPNQCLVGAEGVPGRLATPVDEPAEVYEAYFAYLLSL